MISNFYSDLKQAKVGEGNEIAGLPTKVAPLFFRIDKLCFSCII